MKSPRKTAGGRKAPAGSAARVRGGDPIALAGRGGSEVAEGISVQLLVSLPHCQKYAPVDDSGQQDVCFWLDCHQGELEVSTKPASPGDPRKVVPGRPILVKGRYTKVEIHGKGTPKDGDRDINNAGHLTPC